MLRFVTATLLFVTAFFGDSRACSCYGPLNFCQTVDDNQPELVVLAVKTAGHAHGMNIDILEVLHGTESRQQVIVWGDNGLLCRHYASSWSVGDTVVFALHLIGGQGGLPQEDSADYYISACGRYYLGFSAGQVSGNISGTDTVMAYSTFKTSLTSCGLTTSIEPRNLSGSFMLSPNPATDFVQITLPPGVLELAQIRVVDITGKVMMYSRSVNLGSGNVQLQTTLLPPGAYIVYVTSGYHRAVQKLIIANKL